MFSDILKVRLILPNNFPKKVFYEVEKFEDVLTTAELAVQNNILCLAK